MMMLNSWEFFDEIIPYAGKEVWKEIIHKSSLKIFHECLVNEHNKFSVNTLQPIKRALPDFDFNKYLSPEIVLSYILSVGCYWGKCG